MSKNPQADYGRLQDTLRSIAPKATAIYGIGVVARRLLHQLSDFNVIGLMDKDSSNHGKHIYGAVVLDDREVMTRGVQAIVIAASDVYWRVIAARIAHLFQECGIRIVYPNGDVVHADGDELSGIDTDIPNRAELERQIQHHDLISFDLFETLVTRCAARSDDIFELAIMRVRRETGYVGDLFGPRKEAEAACLDEYGEAAFGVGQIYQKVKQYHLLPIDISEKLLTYELAVEESLAVPRRRTVELLHQCQARGKRVCIVTDTVLPRSTIISILKRCGITEVPHLLISNEHGATKSTGELFRVLKRQYPSTRILHIGDNAMCDGKRAEEQGLTTRKLPSPAAQLLASRFKSLLVEARTTQDGLMLGLIARVLFEDPFTVLGSGGRIRIHDLKQFGYVFFGPLLATWLLWLVGELRRQPVDKLLFFAREGYLLTRLYNRLRDRLQLEDLPEGCYFPTSRRMASVAALRSQEDALELLQDDFSGTPEQLLRLRFGLDHNDASSEEIITNKDPEAATLVTKYMPRILVNAQEERKAYVRYIESLGISSDTPTAVADLGIKGTIQYALQRLLRRSLFGYYITGYFGPANPYGMSDNTAALFPQLKNGVFSHVYRYHILCESVLVGPEGMYLHIDRNGTFVNASARMNQQLFERKSDIHSGIESFLADWLALEIDPGDLSLSMPLVDVLFGQSMEDSVVIDEGVKSACYVDESYCAETEKSIWD